MRLRVHVEDVVFLASRPPEQRTDRETGTVRLDRGTGLPLWSVQVAALDESGGEVLQISVAGEPTGIVVGAPVVVEGLVAIPWAQGDRSGVAFRATAIRPVQTTRAPRAAD